MNEIIRKRKSIRKYEMEPLDTSTLERVQEQINKVKPLYPDIRYSIEITDKTKGLFNIKAPHYLVFRSEVKDGADENTGFIGQQLDLLLPEAGIGTCWLGASKPIEDYDPVLSPVACMSFGKPDELLFREHSEFKRKSLSEISEGADERLEAARLAPSGMNSQRWYFIAENGKIHCYRKKVRLNFTNRMARIDIGIAIYHIAAESKEFSFTNEASAPARKGHVYMGTIG